jgi:hypothetical protein
MCREGVKRVEICRKGGCDGGEGAQRTGAEEVDEALRRPTAVPT